MPEKNIIDLLQSAIDAHEGYVNLKKFLRTITRKMRAAYGVRLKDTAVDTYKTLAPLIDDKFIVHKKGNALYIMEPREPSEIVFAMIAARKKAGPRDLTQLSPFTKKEIHEIINILVEEKRVKVLLNELLEPRVYVIAENSQATKQEYTPENFKAAFDALNNGKIFVRICDLREKLSWPRKIFDDMLKTLRDKEIIQLHTGDASLMTQKEIQDSFIDENNFRLGTVTWHVR